MSLMDGLADGFRWLVGRETDLQTRSDSDGNPSTLGDILARLGPQRTSPWRRAGVSEALGVPAVFKAVSLISNTIGSLSMEAFRRGARLENGDTPRIVVRPNPFTPPNEFWRDSAFYKAVRGETWWWIAKRDLDDSAMSLIPIDPREIMVEANPRNRFRPVIKWLDREMPNDDMVQMMYMRDPNNPLRGIGPLQACGAAVSVAVEAMEYAANFFAGSPSNTVVKSSIEVDDTEAAALKAQWISGPANLPKVIDPRIESVTEVGSDPAKSQMSDTRLFQNGEMSLAFSMPPTLLNYAVQGSTITYQNVGQIADDFLRQCLLPHYLEPMEQAMSDLLTRTTIGRFSVTGLLRPDIRTRYDVYAIGIDKGIIDAEEARQQEGLAPGDIENRPVPFAPPQAVPSAIQTRSLDGPVRCDGSRILRGRLTSCGRLLAENGPFVGTCPRCKKVHAGAPVPVRPSFRILPIEGGGATVEQTA